MLWIIFRLTHAGNTYAPGTCLNRMATGMDTVGGCLHYHSASSYSQYTADYNGVEAIVMGATGLLAPVFAQAG